MSSPKIDRAEIRHVAELASLSLTDEETDAMAAELAAIVRYMGELDAVDTENVPPTAHVQLERAAWRRDVIEPSLAQEDALSQAPESAHGGFAVPVFVES
ncbi:MAG: Asp-tRNA(Asn)/Glu-tRNA(Gln) amidotransferase subunit GatC [Polyangiaceae bacterium]